MLEDHPCAEVWLLSPAYREGFRPRIGDEVSPEQITGWQVLRLEYEGAGLHQKSSKDEPETRRESRFDP